MAEEKNTVTFEITEHIGVISVNEQTGWKKELNRISWSERPPKFDIRDWNPDHSRSGKGATLTDDEARALYGIFDNMFA